MSYPGIGGDIARVSITTDLSEAVYAHGWHGPPMDDVERKPIPSEKPDPHAQWDEAAGRWEVWSDEAGGWVSFEDGTVQEPATPSVEVEGDHPADAD